MCLAQGHNAVTPVRLEPAALGSRVKHSTTGPLGPQTLSLDYISGTFIEDGNQAIFLLEYHCLHVSYFSIMYKLLLKIYKRRMQKSGNHKSVPQKASENYQ